MIVKKPIGAVKINGIISRLTVGLPVPGNVLKFWDETKQLKALEKAGIIGKADKKNGSAGNSGKDEEEIKDDTFHEDKN